LLNSIFQIIQYKSAFNKREFILYSNSDIPSTWEDIDISIKLFLAGLFDVTVSPVSMSDRNRENSPYQMNNGIRRPLSAGSSSLIPSTSFDGRIRLKEQLQQLGVTFVIFLKEEECNASVEVLLDGKFYRVVNPSGNLLTPAYISFAKEKLRIGETALRDYYRKAKFVIFGMFLLRRDNGVTICCVKT
jgi:hypothetical protein